MKTKVFLLICLSAYCLADQSKEDSIESRGRIPTKPSWSNNEQVFICWLRNLRPVEPIDIIDAKVNRLKRLNCIYQCVLNSAGILDATGQLQKSVEIKAILDSYKLDTEDRNTAQHCLVIFEKQTSSCDTAQSLFRCISSFMKWDQVF